MLLTRNTFTCLWHAHWYMGETESLTFYKFYQRPEWKVALQMSEERNRKLNIIISFLSATKHALADSPQTRWWEAELLFILDVYSCMTHQGKNKCVDLTICYNNCRHCSAQLLLGSAHLVEKEFISVQVLL